MKIKDGIQQMTIYVTDEQHKAMRKIYAETGQRMTETVRQAIENYLNERNND